MFLTESQIVSLLVSGGAILLALLHIIMYATTSRKTSHLVGFFAHFAMAYMLLFASRTSIFYPFMCDHIGAGANFRIGFLFIIIFVVSVQFFYASMAKFRQHNWPFVWTMLGVIAAVYMLCLFGHGMMLYWSRLLFYGVNLLLQVYCFRLILQSYRKGDKHSFRVLILYSIYVLILLINVAAETYQQSGTWIKYFIAYVFLVILDSDIIIRYRFEVTPTSEAVKEWQGRFTQQISDLRTSNASKDKFLSIVAHDLKNPISSLKALSDIYAEDARHKNDSHYLELTQMMNSCISSVYRLLDNLLTWARSQNGSIKYEPLMLSPQDLASKLCDYSCAICKPKNITLNVQVVSDAAIFADIHMVETILRNLVTNSVKFSFPDSAVDVVFDSDADFSIIRVKDHGVGMSKDTLGKLFHIDEVCSTSGTNNESGTGLGLLICYEFVNKHGGHISVSSEEGVGTTFSVFLPYKQKTEDDITSPSAKKNEK
ncbi:MAG: HAMP domain-containing histidine kinase [Bacteroidales bacterium]|nr:HAMP domain-containing histidine kinase [Bacteroidales bacterium]